MIMNKIVGVNDHEPSYFHLENCTGWVDLMASFPLPGGEIKLDPEIGKTAIQPEPAQTADLSISGSL